MTKVYALIEVLSVMFVIMAVFVGIDIYYNETPTQYAKRINKYTITSNNDIYYTRVLNSDVNGCLHFEGYTPLGRLPFDKNSMKYHGYLTRCEANFQRLVK